MSSVRRISVEGKNILRCKVGTFGDGAARNVEGDATFSCKESRVSTLEGTPSESTTRTSGSRTILFGNVSESDSETTLRTVSESAGNEGAISGNIPRCSGEKIKIFSTRKRFSGEEATFSKRVTKFSADRSKISESGTRFSRKLTNQPGRFCRNWTRISKEGTTDFLSGVALTDKEDHLTEEGTRFSRHEHDQKMRFFTDETRGRSKISEIGKRSSAKDLQVAGERTPFSGSGINAGTQISPFGTSVCGSAGTRSEGSLKEYGAGAFIQGDESVDRQCGDTPCQVYVSNLDYRVGWRTLRKVFAVAGTVLNARLLTDFSGKSRGSATVRFQTPTDALRAVSVLNCQDFFGRKMIVRIDRKNRFGKQHSSHRTNFIRLAPLSTKEGSRAPSEELVSSHHTQSCIPFSPISSHPQDCLDGLTKPKPCNHASDKELSDTHVLNDETPFEISSDLCCPTSFLKTVNGKATYRDIPQNCSNDLTGDAFTDKDVFENVYGNEYGHCYDDAEKENDAQDTVSKGSDTGKGTDSSNGNGSSQVLKSPKAFESQTVAASVDRFDLRETIHRIRRRNSTRSFPLADCEDVSEISPVECSGEEHNKKRKKTTRHSAADLLGTGDRRHSDKENTGHGVSFPDRNMDKISNPGEQLVCDSVAMLEVERNHQAAERKFSFQDPRPQVSSTSADWGGQDLGWDGGWQEEHNTPVDQQSDDCGSLGRERLFHTTGYLDSLVHSNATQKLKTAEYSSASEAFNHPHFSTGVDNSQWPVGKGDTSQLPIPTGNSQHRAHGGERNGHQIYFGQHGNQPFFVKQDQGHPENIPHRPDHGQRWGWRHTGAVEGSRCREEERTALLCEQRMTGTGNLLSTAERDGHQKEEESHFPMNAVPELLPGNEFSECCCYWAPPRDALFLQSWSPQFQTGILPHPSTTLCKNKDTLRSSSHTIDQNKSAILESTSELMPCSLKETSKVGHHNIDASVSSTTPYVMNEAEMPPQPSIGDESVQASFDAAKLEILRILPEDIRPSRVIPQQAHVEKDYQSCSFPQSPRISHLQEALNAKLCNFSHNDCFTADSIPAEYDQRWFQTCEKPFRTSTTSMSATEETQRPKEVTVSYRTLEETERMARSLVDISSFQDLASQALSLLFHTPAPNAEYPHPESSHVHAAWTISKALQQASAAASGLSLTLAANLELCGRQGVLEKEDLDPDTKRQLRNLPLGDPRVFVDRVLAVKGQGL